MFDGNEPVSADSKRSTLIISPESITVKYELYPQPIYNQEVNVHNPFRLAESKKQDGNELYKKQMYKDALKFYTEAIQICPDVPSYYSNRAACHMMVGNYRGALEDAKQSTELDSGFVKGYVREVKCAIALGDLISADRSLEKVCILDPGNAACQTEQRNINYLKEIEQERSKSLQFEDYRKIVFLMDKALGVSPACHKFRLQKAESLVYLKRYQEAQDIANDILKFDCNNIDAFQVRGTCLYFQDNLDKAFPHFQRILRLAPDHTKAKEMYRKAKQILKLKEEGNESFKKNEFSQAHELYSQALKIDPQNVLTNAKLYCNRATTNAKLGKLKEAVTDCTKAIKLDKTYLKAYLRRAKCYMDLEEYEEAVRDYEHVFKKDKSRENKASLQRAKLELKKSKRKDYYKLLGVLKNATENEIKKAYRKRAMIHHPDRHSTATEAEKKEQEKKFKEVGEAYGVLSDPKKRSRYDNGLDLEDGSSGFDMDADSVFQAFFGGGGGGFEFHRGGGGGGQSGYQGFSHQFFDFS